MVTCDPIVSFTLDVTEERASKALKLLPSIYFHLTLSALWLVLFVTLFLPWAVSLPLPLLVTVLIWSPSILLTVTSMHRTPKPLYSDLNAFLCCTPKCLNYLLDIFTWIFCTSKLPRTKLDLIQNVNNFLSCQTGQKQKPRQPGE